MQDETFQLVDLDTGSEQAGENELTTLVDLVAFVKQKQFQLFVRYSMNQFRGETIVSFVERFSKELGGLITYCCEQGEGRYTPSNLNLPL